MINLSTVPSNHRTYRSVYGGSQNTTNFTITICKAHKTKVSPIGIW